MERVYRIGTAIEYPGTPANVFLKATVENGGLSISGVVGPKKDGDARGSCGQIIGVLSDDSMEYAEGWNREMVSELAEIWKRWHLNDTRAGCEHQRSAGWSQRPIDPGKPTNTYGRHFEGQQTDSWNSLGWIRRSEHPEGLLSHPCPECGYEYGTAWLMEELPAYVQETLESFPATDKTPAWI
jgi:hypothetical protein